MNYSSKKTLRDLEVHGKKVLVRVDFNVPLKDGKITDDNRIHGALPTIKYLQEHGAKIILLSHLGRIKSAADQETKSLAPIAKRLEELLKKPVQFIPETRGEKLTTAVNNLKNGEVLLVENTRFEDFKDGVLVKSESKNAPELGKYWASLGDIFVNDAFGTAHRAHASNVGISQNIPVSAVGFLVEKELAMLSQGILKAQKPFIAILGGAKVSDKIGVIENLLPKVDKILIGGGMAYTFLKAAGHQVGNSLVETEKLAEAKHYLAIAPEKIVLPVDSANAPTFADQKPSYSGVNLPDGEMGLDIGPKTIARFQKELANAKTVVWNGPMGVSEFPHFAKGTIAICESIAKLPNAFTLIGGGDSAAAAISLGYKDKFSWISTGGGASLTFMEGKTLPGIEAVQNR